MSADLHVHTLYSDGTFTPEEVVREAVRIGLEAVAITDHDCIDGISPAMKAAENTRLEIIPGIEISAVAADTEIHILGYFIDWHDPVLVEILRKMKANRVERMRKMVKLLNKAGFNIDPEQVIKSVPEGTIGRLHLARLMCEKGFVRGTQEAFDRYIGDGKPCSVRHERLDYDRAIKMILDAGGVPVLAHPGVMGNDRYIDDYVKAGLRGLEVYHTDHETPQNGKYLRMAREKGLVATGGSDCHGMKKGRILIGKVRMDHEVVEKLREESGKIRKAHG